MNPDIIRKKREIESAKKDMAMLNIEYLKRKQDIDDYLFDREYELKELESNEKSRIDYCG